MAKTQSITKVRGIIDNYSQFQQNKTNRILQWICLPLITFGFLGVIWSIPFPYLEFLGKYNGYVNFASFLIAFYVYYYYRLSALASYVILLVVFAYSAGVVTLEKLHTNEGWPLMGEVCFILLTIGLLVQFIGYKKEGKFPPSGFLFNSLLFGPLWLMRAIIKK